MLQKSITSVWIEPRSIEFGSMIQVVSNPADVREQRLYAAIGGGHFGPDNCAGTVDLLPLGWILQDVLGRRSSSSKPFLKFRANHLVCESIPVNNYGAVATCLVVPSLFQR